MVTPKDQFASAETMQARSARHRSAETSRTEAIYDAELVRRLNRGDETAFVAIMLRYRERLFSVALTFKGVVQLSGFENSENEKSQAGSVAGTIAGVTDVRNDIVVK